MTGSPVELPELPEVTPLQLRHTMSRFVTGVAVVTTVVDGHDSAMTASSLTSVSLEPPLVLVCVQQGTGWHEAVLEAGIWGVSVLPASARPTASWLSTRGRPLLGQLDRVPHHRGALGVALLDGAVATLECRTQQTHVAGDHTIVVGHVVSATADDPADDPLTYYRSRYGSMR